MFMKKQKIPLIVKWIDHSWITWMIHHGSWWINCSSNSELTIVYHWSWNVRILHCNYFIFIATIVHFLHFFINYCNFIASINIHKQFTHLHHHPSQSHNYQLHKLHVHCKPIEWCVLTKDNKHIAIIHLDLNFFWK